MVGKKLQKVKKKGIFLKNSAYSRNFDIIQKKLLKSLKYYGTRKSLKATIMHAKC